MEVGWGQESFAVSSNFYFSMSLVFFPKSMSSAKYASSGKSAIAAQGQAVQPVIGRWENSIVYSFFHINYYYCFYCYYFLCLIKLPLSQPTSFTFCPFSFPSHCGVERESGCMVLVAGCRVKPQQPQTAGVEWVLRGIRAPGGTM